jgi:hypothetical protein
MAVTAAFNRTYNTTDTGTYTEFVTATLSGTYATGGFTWNPFSIFGGQGSSPLASTVLLDADFLSPLGYIYRTTVNTTTNVATTKIFSAANTELTAGATPEASVPVVLRKRKI